MVEGDVYHGIKLARFLYCRLKVEVYATIVDAYRTFGVPSFQCFLRFLQLIGIQNRQRKYGLEARQSVAADTTVSKAG